jgi:integrase
MPLTDRAIKLAELREKQYKLFDEKGLYLLINPNGSRYWRLKYRISGKEKTLSIGVYPEISLKEARDERDKARKQLKEGVDPSADKQVQKILQNVSRENSFEPIAREWLKIPMSDRSESYLKKIERGLERYVFPFIGGRPITEISAQEILVLLRKVESKGIIDTAHRLRWQMGAIFRYAIVTSRCSYNPTADLKGALRPHKPEHFSAITDPDELGRLLLAIYNYAGTAVVIAALKCTALWLCRQVELRHLEWTQVDWKKKRIELVSAKKYYDHIIPLSTQSIEILTELYAITGRGKYVFPSARGGSRPLSENGVRVALRTMGYENDDQTPHGFRATARTILDEVLEYPQHLIEHQLAHRVKDENGRAYNRTKHLDKREKMLQHWADYLDELRLGASD